MIRYMLDTNMIAYTKNRRPASVLERLHQHDTSEICISAITIVELNLVYLTIPKPKPYGSNNVPVWNIHSSIQG